MSLYKLNCVKQLFVSRICSDKRLLKTTGKLSMLLSVFGFRQIIDKHKRFLIIKFLRKSRDDKKFFGSVFPFPLYLISTGAFDWNDEDAEFFAAVKRKSYKQIERALKSGFDPNVKHPLGWTALHIAAANNSVQIVKLLLEHNANLNVMDEYVSADAVAWLKKKSTIFVASCRETEFSCKLNPNTSFSGFTPLHYACLLGHTEVVRLLLEAGASPHVKTIFGQSPLDFTKDEKIKELLEFHMNRVKEEVRLRNLEDRLQNPLEKRLKEKIVGQEGPINNVAMAIRRKENGWVDDEHPLVFLFLGSSGIGKTELAKQLAYYLHKENPNGFIRLDMSEYQEKHEAAKLIGSPPGYVGHEQGGQLTKKLAACPKAVVLFDEVDKAHPDVLTVLLQLFDEGRLTDGQGKTVNCKDAIFIMTSNLASHVIAEQALQLRSAAEKARNFNDGDKSLNKDEETVSISRSFKDKVVKPILKEHFRRDEFLGRINEIVYFLPFSSCELMKLVHLELTTWAKRASERHNITLKWDPDVLAAITKGYDIDYGARSIKHEVERCIIGRIADAHEKGFITEGSTVEVKIKYLGTEREPEIFLSVRKKDNDDFVTFSTAELSHASPTLCKKISHFILK